ncbi:MAG: polysaccharide biosynthesis tyrosine autokinase [Chloroflexi bacterium]|nr:polysaccharide biosynthesis tyrosine autokinase [Chloroflexota bacterium]MBU1751989.1 polysaccharide biosynthesis tyrosine autokinase [Chloroflexota bacterium]
MAELELRQYLGLFKKWWWLVVLGAVLAGGSAYVVSINTPPIYEAASMLLVTYGEDPTLSSSNTNPIILSRLASNYATLLDQPVILETTASRLGLARVKGEDVTVDWEENQQIIRLLVRDHVPQNAADIANTIPVVFGERNASLQSSRFAESKEALSKELKRLETDIEATQTLIDAIGTATTVADEVELARLETTLARYRYNYGQLLADYEKIRMSEANAIENIVIFQAASAPQNPIYPRTTNNVLLAAAVGMALAVGIAFLVEYLDDTIKTAEDVAHVLGLNTLGTIARLRSGRRGNGAERLVTSMEPRSPISEAFRTLRTNIQFSSVDKPMRRLLVTSSGPGEGKSLTAANLAIVFAQAGQSVVLVDADLRRPVQHKLFDLSNDTGVTNGLLGDANPGVEQWLLPTSVENLRLLASGPLPPNPSELLGSQRMAKFIEHLAQQVDLVVFDTPPVLAVTDAAVLSRQMDGVLVVVEAGGTRDSEARRAINELAQV